MGIETRIMESPEAAEIYITAVPCCNKEAKKQAEELFSGIAEILSEKNARIFQERLFATRETMDEVCATRRSIYGNLDNTVAPCRLAVPSGRNGPVTGVQVHAVSTSKPAEILRLGGTPCGRLIRAGKGVYATLSGISAPQAGDKAAQACSMFEKAESVLNQTGTDTHSVARTWLWLADILDWYDGLNSIRNQFFRQRGLVHKNGSCKLPASTGIGISPFGGASCVMDLIAVIEPADSIYYHLVGGHQGSAYDYGSAFSRASRAPSPAGQTVFVSGTASIDAKGATLHRGDAPAQITATIENVRAILKDMNCCDQDVVQSIIYCKTAEVENLFCDKWSQLPWPRITAIADICREDLLFEIEATAVIPAVKL
ncbi:MAG: Rid family hydrolase [Planctomycetota bacterium]